MPQRTLLQQRPPAVSDAPSEHAVHEQLRRIESTLGGGTLGVAAYNPATGETVSYNADDIFPTASVIKVAIVAEAYIQQAKGILSLTDVVEVTEGDKVAGSGVLSHLTPGVRLPLKDLAQLAIMVSDNTASNLCLRAVGGPEAVNRRMHEEWGMKSTTVHRPIKFRLEPDDPPYTATGSPRDMMRLMQIIGAGELHSPEVSAQMDAILRSTVDESLLPRYLEVNPYAADLKVAEPAFVVAHKTGAVNGVRNDAGIIRRAAREEPGYFVVCVYTRNVTDVRWTPANQGSEAVARVGELLTTRWLGAH